jgi:hypothetical protein
MRRGSDISKEQSTNVHWLSLVLTVGSRTTWSI